MTTRVTEGARRKRFIFFSFRAAALISRVSRRSRARALSSLNLKKRETAGSLRKQGQQTLKFSFGPCKGIRISESGKFLLV